MSKTAATLRLVVLGLLIFVAGALPLCASIPQNRIQNALPTPIRNRVMGFAHSASGRHWFEGRLRLEIATGCVVSGVENASVRRYFLSPDPLGHGASMDLYSYCNGDPVNGLDPDGRFGKAGNGQANDLFYNGPDYSQGPTIAEEIAEQNEYANALFSLPVMSTIRSGFEWNTGNDFVTGDPIQGGRDFAVDFAGSVLQSSIAVAALNPYGDVALSIQAESDMTSTSLLSGKNPLIQEEVSIPGVSVSNAANGKEVWQEFTEQRQQQQQSQPIQNHHAIPYDNSTFDFQNHPLVQQAGVNLKTDPRNQFNLANHVGRHTNNYNRNIQARLDAAFSRVAGQSQQAADAELGQVMGEIQNDIYNGSLSPYSTKVVSKP